MISSIGHTVRMSDGVSAVCLVCGAYDWWTFEWLQSFTYVNKYVCMYAYSHVRMCLLFKYIINFTFNLHCICSRLISLFSVIFFGNIRYDKWVTLFKPLFSHWNYKSVGVFLAKIDSSICVLFAVKFAIFHKFDKLQLFCGHFFIFLENNFL